MTTQNTVSIHGRMLSMNPRTGQMFSFDRALGDPVNEGWRTILPRYVHSGTGATGVSGHDPSSPLTTLQAAIDLADAASEDNLGSRIVILPNHSETVTGVAGLTFDVDGMEIIGLGTGNQRPRFLMDGGTTVTALVSGADVYIENIVMASGHLLVATGFDVTGVHATFVGVEWEDNTTAENWGTPYKATGTDNTADGLTVINNRWVPLVATVNCLEFVEVTGNIAKLSIVGNHIIHEGTASPLILTAGSKVMHGVDIRANRLSHKMTANDLLVDNGGSTNSGIIAENWVGHADVSSAHAMGAATGCRFFENKSVSTAVLSGFLLPAADVDS
jgi:hypothetical protein